MRTWAIDVAIGAVMVLTAVVGLVVLSLHAEQPNPGLCDLFPWLPGC
jgi:hypothetical protein